MRPATCLPAAPPTADIGVLVAAVAAEFEGTIIGGAVRKARGEDFEAADDVADHLIAEGLVLGDGRKGELYVSCPWKEGHSSDSGITEAAYFPAGTGGYQRGHYVCLHASCLGRSDEDFLSAIGLGVEQDFEDLGPLPAPAPKRPVLDPNDPMGVARSLADRRFRDAAGNRTLLRANSSWFEYGGASYVERDDEQVRGVVWHFLDGAHREQSVKETVDGKKIERRILVPFQPQPRHATATMDTLRAVVARGKLEVPSWIEGTGPDPRNLVPLTDGLLDMPRRTLMPHDPRFFSLNALPFAWGDDAARPDAWLRFLADVFDGDTQAIETLQEMFGYLLTPDTSQQKIFLIVGQRRSGKGTIGRVLRGLVGEHNTTSPTLNSLTDGFGLEPLIGKLMALVGDARPSSSKVQVVVERLLSISGEDSISVGRKHKSAWEGRLPARFVVMSNEVPQLADASGALAGRFLILNTRKTFYGKEDTGLTEKLLAELPAIFRWALDGRDRLWARGYFEQPSSGKSLVDDMARANSPVLAFVEECCELTPTGEVLQQELWAHWREWCRGSGRMEGNVQVFAKNIAAAFPNLSTYRPMVKSVGKQMPAYRGLGLLPAYEAGLMEPNSLA